jgi:hypothetical protein
MQTTRLHRMLVLAGLFSLFVSYVGLWIRFINDPVERTGSDFIAFYTAGRLVQSEGFQSVYDIDLQQDVQEAEVGFPLVPGQVLLYNHLPILLPLLQWIVSTDYIVSFYRWITLLILAYSAALAILSQVLKRQGVDRPSNLLIGVAGFLFLPVFFSLMNGQDTAMLLLGVAIWMYGLISRKELLAGLGLSLATLRPHLALFLAIPMLFRNRNIFWGFVLGSLILALLSVLLLGAEGTKDYMNILLLSGGGEWYGMKENAMYNLIGLLSRFLPQVEAGMIRASGWLFYGAALICISMLWFKAQDLNSGLIGLTILCSIVTAPHLHFHDLALLLITIYDLGRLSKKYGTLNMSSLAAVPLVFSLLLLISNLSRFLQYTTPYLIMLTLALYPYFLKPAALLTRPRRS